VANGNGRNGTHAAGVVTVPEVAAAQPCSAYAADQVTIACMPAPGAWHDQEIDLRLPEW
jgi:hypothetical protein